MEKKPSKLKILTAGIIKDNPVLVLVLGTCPTLAMSSSVANAVGMGLAATLVLIGSNVVISLLRKVIPDKVRIPCYIVVIAGFVTVVSLLMQAYFQSLFAAMGVFLDLIVVNCIILGRAEMFANKNTAVDSLLDGIGMGLGFTLALFILSSLREILGVGTWIGMPVFSDGFAPLGIMAVAPGGFFAYGLIIAILNKLTKGKGVKRKSFDCESCPVHSTCSKASKGGCEK